MTPETEKILEALAMPDVCEDGWHEKLDQFHEKYGVSVADTIEQAARRYAEVLPLLGDIKAITSIEEKDKTTEMHVRLIMDIEKIAAIVARGE